MQERLDAISDTYMNGSHRWDDVFWEEDVMSGQTQLSQHAENETSEVVPLGAGALLWKLVCLKSCPAVSGM
jgi:hypothetical protein